MPSSRRVGVAGNGNGTGKQKERLRLLWRWGGKIFHDTDVGERRRDEGIPPHALRRKTNISFLFFLLSFFYGGDSRVQPNTLKCILFLT